jgi:hypothetical protein
MTKLRTARVGLHVVWSHPAYPQSGVITDVQGDSIFVRFEGHQESEPMFLHELEEDVAFAH